MLSMRYIAVTVVLHFMALCVACHALHDHDAKIFRSENGTLHINSGVNETVLIDGVDVLKSLQEIQHELATLKKATFPSRDCRDALSRFGPVSGVYTVQPDPHMPPFTTICDQEGDDGGGWMLAVFYSASQLPIADIDGWPSVWGETDTSRTRMYKGSLKGFSEARESVASGNFSVWGQNLTAPMLEAIRRSFAYEERISVIGSLPACLRAYNQSGTSQRRCSTCSQAGEERILGWQCDVAGPGYCWAGRGWTSIPRAGSGRCVEDPSKGEPNGSTWAALYIR